MPTYDYECDACQATWELFQKITEDPIPKCPHCKKKKARRLFGTGAALMFKGSGFYETDYRSDSYKKSAKADSKTSQTNDSKSGDSKSNSSKSDTPSPAKSESKGANTTNSQSQSKSEKKPKK